MTGRIRALWDRLTRSEADYKAVYEEAIMPEIRRRIASLAERVELLGEPVASGEGWREPLARRLWPKLVKVVACGAGAYAEARQFVRRFTGDVVWNNGPVFLPETVLAHAEADGTDRYVFDGAGLYRVVTDAEIRVVETGRDGIVVELL